MMKTYWWIIKINHNPNCLCIPPDHQYNILIVARSGLDKTDVLLNLIKHQQPDIDKKIFMSKINLKHSNNTKRKSQD